jgi:tetratricopeptide (TPR) repeat protein
MAAPVSSNTIAIPLMVLLSLFLPSATAQSVSSQIEGLVRDSAGKPLAGVSVILQAHGQPDFRETQTTGGGTFAFSEIPSGAYTVQVRKPMFREVIDDSIQLSPAEKKHCEFVLQSSTASPPASATSMANGIQLDDRPNFTVAGITDSSGSGGHASETRLRTGEALAKETLKLKDNESQPDQNSLSLSDRSETDLRAALVKNPRSFETNHQLGELYFRAQRYREAIPLLEVAFQAKPQDYANALDLAQAIKNAGEFAQARTRLNQMLANESVLSGADRANLHRLLGGVDENLNDPLEAERQYERAVSLDPSEQNYFAWGSELLLHRAAAPALEVFGKGVRLHPTSARMLAGLGAALFTSSSADEAAQRLCQASDLEPDNPAPYLFLGEMQEGTAAPLPCVEQKLARFAANQPKNALANYYYGLALLKGHRASENPHDLQHAQSLLERASVLDPKLDVALLQLGNLHFSAGGFQEAIDAYGKAIAVNPLGSEAHYRLGIAYKRAGEESKANAEFELFKRLDKTEADKVEQQRRELRQFLFVLKDQPSGTRPLSDAVSPSTPKQD